ncbi:MAG: hypothetical protein NE334_15390 [Lentisphaeraceae bacterium]|nr:hypothetical protein [Lentisphaeraceae bacterium]
MAKLSLKKKIIVVFIILMIGLFINSFVPKYDLAKVDKILLAECEGVTRLSADTYLDGGSLGIKLYKNGIFTNEVFIPHNNDFEKFIIIKDVNSLYGNNAIIPQKKPLNQDSKEYLIALIKEVGNTDGFENSVLVSLGDSKATYYVRGILRYFR